MQIVEKKENVVILNRIDLISGAERKSIYELKQNFQSGHRRVKEINYDNGAYEIHHGLCLKLIKQEGSNKS
jgi:hypothetical protein